MDQLSLKESCLCHFCETAVTSKSLFPVELSDRLYDLSALQALTDELKSETIELVELNDIVTVVEKRDRIKVEELQIDRKTRTIEEHTAKNIDSCCLQLAEQSVELRKEKEALGLLQQKRIKLNEKLCLKKALQSSLIENMKGAPECVRAMRFREACAIFDMIKIIANPPPRSSKTKNEKIEPLRGYSTIMGLPLLNNGVYDGIPVEIVSSALSFAAHLVDTVAAILNISLDHPIRPFETFECVTSPNSDQSFMLPLTPAVSQNLNTQHLLEPFAADYRNQLFDKKLLVKIPMSRLNNAKIEKSESKNLKETSKNCRNGEDKKNQTNDENEIGMNDEWIVNPSFVMALSLFRANIITLCLRCGIDGFALWPHEAILLNLDLLHSRCIQENESSILSTDKYKLKFKSGDINLFPTVFDELNSDNGCDDPLSGLIRRYKSKRIIKPLGAN